MPDLFKINAVSFTAGLNTRPVTVSATMSGGVLVVRGPSGAGKSTLLRVLARLRACSGGEVSLSGIGWSEFPPVLWRRLVHYLAQKPTVFDGTVLDNLKKPFELAAVKKDLFFDEAAAHDGMERLLLPAKLLRQDARTLSGGEAARVALLRALLLKPAVLLLDEPTSALDEQARSAVLGVVGGWLAAEPNRGVVLVSHADDMSFFERPAVLTIDPQAEGGA